MKEEAEANRLRCLIQVFQARSANQECSLLISLLVIFPVCYAAAHRGMLFIIQQSLMQYELTYFNEK